MADPLTKQIAVLAEDAAARATTDEVAAELRGVLERLRGPIRLAVAGKVKAGKSTLLNALIGEQLAPTDAGECTRIVTWYHHSDRPRVLLHPRVGAPEERPYTRSGALRIDLGNRDASAVHHLEVGWPTSRLRDLVLIDTPGIASVSADVSARTHEVMSAESGRAPVADAVLYLLRHTHSSDIRFLEAFHDDEIAHGTAVNTIGVLSRADEIGSCRLDAMAVAARVARRYESDARLHRLCPLVVPVDGLLGHAAVTLRQSEFGELAAVAGAPAQARGDLLLTADRFATQPSTVEPSPEQRTALLDRLGLFGVRLAVRLIESGAADSSSDLCRQLAETSGLDRVRDVVLVQFLSRARVLKARSAVSALQDVLHRGGCGEPSDLHRRLEEITSGAHEFEEIRVLLDLRSGELRLPPAREAELDRLMGGAGHDVASRLGLPNDASPGQLRETALSALATWQGVEHHPLSSRAVQIAARAAARTLEGMLADEAIASR